MHGKIECTFKPDYKVLVTLIYADKQLEGSGEETPLELRDGSFQGEVAFDRYSSSNPFKGDVCKRQPKRVLLRLIASDGTEQDRKELEIAKAFQYDAAQGRFTPQTDLILRGWCELPKCPHTPSTR